MKTTISAAGLKKLQSKLNKLQSGQQEFVESCAKNLAARLLSRVIPRTPVGQYPKTSGKKGGTLRRGWIAKNYDDAISHPGTPSAPDQMAFIDGLKVNQTGKMFSVQIVNPVEYAQYVEFGHRQGKTGFIPGRFMLTTSENEIRDIAPTVIDKRLKAFLGVLK